MCAGPDTMLLVVSECFIKRPGRPLLDHTIPTTLLASMSLWMACSSNLKQLPFWRCDFQFDGMLLPVAFWGLWEPIQWVVVPVQLIGWSWPSNKAFDITRSIVSWPTLEDKVGHSTEKFVNYWIKDCWNYVCEIIWTCHSYINAMLEIPMIVQTKSKVFFLKLLYYLGK